MKASPGVYKLKELLILADGTSFQPTGLFHWLASVFVLLLFTVSCLLA